MNLELTEKEANLLREFIDESLKFGAKVEEMTTRGYTECTLEAQPRDKDESWKIEMLKNISERLK